MTAALADLLAEFRRQRAEFEHLRSEQAYLVDRAHQLWAIRRAAFRQFTAVWRERQAVSDDAIAASYAALVRAVCDAPIAPAT